MNSLHNINPNPVPVSPSVPLLDRLASTLNKFFISSGDIPIPLSLILISICPSFLRLLMAISPPLYVNFIALVRRFRITVLIIFLSAYTSQESSILCSIFIFFVVIFSFNRFMFCSTNCFRLKIIGSNAILSVCVLAHCRRFSSKL